MGGDSSKLHCPPSEGEGEPNSSHDNPHPSGETLHHLQAELGNLTDHELHQLVEDLHQEITPCELNAPPEALHQCLGGTHQGEAEPKRVKRRSPFQEGEGGSPRTTIPISYTCVTRWRMGSSGTTSTAPTSCSTKSRHGALNKYSGIGFKIGYP